MGAKASYSTLRNMYRQCDFRRFRAMNNDNRWADIMGIGPKDTAIGWWNDTTEIVELEPDEVVWTNMTRYL